MMHLHDCEPAISYLQTSDSLEHARSHSVSLPKYMQHVQFAIGKGRNAAVQMPGQEMS